MSLRTWSLAAALALSACQPLPEPMPPPMPPQFGVFHDDLAPYGTWVYTGDHDWVWIPDPAIVGPGFMPYVTGGAWVATDVGWMWVSIWEWGWAPFHYGGWVADPLHGWVWVPDTEWAPAWVDWRSGGGYVGWAPLPPRHHWVEVRDHRARWVFAHPADLTADHLEHVVVPAHEADRALSVTVPVRTRVQFHDRTWYAGPAAAPSVAPIKIKPPHDGELIRPATPAVRPVRRTH